MAMSTNGDGDDGLFKADVAAAQAIKSQDPAVARKKRPIVEPAPLERHGPARIIALCNQKGGVGKTTSTINLGAALAEVGRRVLLVDFDPQGALSVGLGVQPHQLDRTAYNLLMERNVSVDDVLLKTGVPGMDLLPSNIDLSAAEVQLVGEVAREQTLGRVLRPVVDDYDFVLIDCQPSLGLLTVNALTAADGVIIPLECEFFSLRGVALLIDTIEKVRERLNPALHLDGILATMYDGRTLHGREVYARVLEAFGDKVFDTVISRTVRFPRQRWPASRSPPGRRPRPGRPPIAIWPERCCPDEPPNQFARRRRTVPGHLDRAPGPAIRRGPAPPGPRRRAHSGSGARPGAR